MNCPPWTVSIQWQLFTTSIFSSQWLYSSRHHLLVHCTVFERLIYWPSIMLFHKYLVTQHVHNIWYCSFSDTISWRSYFCEKCKESGIIVNRLCFTMFTSTLCIQSHFRKYRCLLNSSLCIFWHHSYKKIVSLYHWTLHVLYKLLKATKNLIFCLLSAIINQNLEMVIFLIN